MGSTRRKELILNSKRRTFNTHEIGNKKQTNEAQSL